MAPQESPLALEQKRRTTVYPASRKKGKSERESVCERERQQLSKRTHAQREREVRALYDGKGEKKEGWEKKINNKHRKEKGV